MSIETTQPIIRNTVKAICRNQNNDILLLLKRYEDGREAYTLPGGSQEAGETLFQTLQRECEEEIGCAVHAGDLHYVCEHFKPAKLGKPPRHKVEFGFACTVPGTYTPCMGHHPDPHQVDVVWVAQEKLAGIVLMPKGLTQILHEEAMASGYRGVVGDMRI